MKATFLKCQILMFFLFWNVLVKLYIYHEGNISKMPDFDVFSVLECKKRKSRSHGKR